MPHLNSQSNARQRLSRRIIAAPARLVRRRASQPGDFFRYPPLQSAAEERANFLTHALASVATLPANVWLISAALRHGDPVMIFGCTIYSVSLTVVFTMSALSHLFEAPRVRHLFRTLDQACIYVLIAGSCTPFFIRFLLPYGWGWMLPAVWGIALFGTWAKLRGDRVNSVSLVLYIVLGWFPIVAAKPLLAHLPAGCTFLVLASAALYMLGVVFLSLDNRRRFFHAVWHVLVIAASACVWSAELLYAVP